MSMTVSRTRSDVGELVHHAWRPAPADPLAPFVDVIVDRDGVVPHPRERTVDAHGGIAPAPAGGTKRERRAE